tara:strand:+ start:5150 stop:5281 length:132 start_codon:yes stop_codon:yes gene_type:complete
MISMAFGQLLKKDKFAETHQTHLNSKGVFLNTPKKLKPNKIAN